MAREQDRPGVTPGLQDRMVSGAPLVAAEPHLVDVEARKITYPLSLRALNVAIYGAVDDTHEWAILNAETTNFGKTHWAMDDLGKRRAGQAIAAGVPGFVPFGPFAALMFHPHEESMRSVNVAKGRGPDQVASVVTTREHVESLFDLENLEGGLTREGVMNMINTFYDRSEDNEHRQFAGPFGFRGPAAAHIPDHLTTIDSVTKERTVQLIAPGYDCESNDIVAEALTAMKKRDETQPNYIAITSANPSSHKTGKLEPAHFRRLGIQAEFGKVGEDEYPLKFFIVGYETNADEDTVANRYLNHDRNSTTILDFSHAEASADGVTTVHLARHGSLPNAITEGVVNNLGMNFVIPDSAAKATPLREYPEDTLVNEPSKQLVPVNDIPDNAVVLFPGLRRVRN